MPSDSDEDDFVEYGNQVEQFDEETLPRKKATSVRDQIATDKHGRRRFHGAFTGGFSAGFFNSVGSLEGWTPAAFKSSRSEKAKLEQQKPEDFMDDEDMDEFGIAPKVLQARNDFNDSSLKRKKHHQLSDGPIPGKPVLSELLCAAKETVGIKLLMKMGWKPGQGVGPRVTKAEKKRMKEEYGKTKRKVYGCSLPQELSKRNQSDSEDNGSTDDENFENITFAPDDVQPALCKPKDNFFGLGFSGLDRRPILSSHISLFEPAPLKMTEKKKKVLIAGQAFGVGAFEDEDQDIYCQDDMSQYDFSLESTSTASKQQSGSKQFSNYSENILEGFLLGENSATFKRYFPPPSLPNNFQPTHKLRISRFEPITSSSEIKHSNDAKKKGLQRHIVTAVERAAILEDVDASTMVKIKQETDTDVGTNKLISTKLGYSNFKPFAADPEKEKRYEQYLELSKKGQKERLSYYQPITMTEWEKERERVEFEKASILYQPLSRMMSDRFVSASQPDDLNNPLASLSKPVDEEEEDKRAAVKMKMFGRLTREEVDWQPCRLLCKRFNVPELFPGSGKSSNVKTKSSKFSVFDFLEASSYNKRVSLPSEEQCDQSAKESSPTTETPDIDTTEKLPILENDDSSLGQSSREQKVKEPELEFPDPPVKVDLFKAIFLSSSDDDSEDDEKKQDKVEPETLKKMDSEANITLEGESIDLPDMEISTPKNIQRNLSPPRGVFANLDLDAVNSHRKDKSESNKETDKPQNNKETDINGDKIEDDDTADVSNEQATQNSVFENMYGPVLPDVNSLTVKSSASAPSSKLLSSVMISESSKWVEKTDREIQHHKKHKKHKKSSKHKKSKHRKKKH